MGEALKKVQQHAQKQGKHKARKLPAEERHALLKIQQGARKAGAVLKSSGEGGLPPSLVLGVMRRDQFTCKVHGDKGEGEYSGLTVHHKGGIVESKWLSTKGHSNDPNNIVTLCDKAHNAIHVKAKKEGVDSQQVMPKGDVGTNRDHGDLPVSKK